MNPDVFLFTGALGVCLLLLVIAYDQFDRYCDKTGDGVNETPHDVGPDALRLLQDLDAHLDEYVAADTELAAGFARLRQAIRDEQQKGEL